MANWVTVVLTDPYWIGGVTWGAAALTLVGLGMTYSQALKARKAAEAAKNATVRAVAALKFREHLVGLGEAGQLATRIKDYAFAGNAQATRLALELLRGKIDNLGATAEVNRVTNREHRQLDEVIQVLERHVDESLSSTVVGLDATTISHQLNEVRRVLTRRMERVKRTIPESGDG